MKVLVLLLSLIVAQVGFATKTKPTLDEFYHACKLTAECIGVRMGVNPFEDIHYSCTLWGEDLGGKTIKVKDYEKLLNMFVKCRAHDMFAKCQAYKLNLLEER